MNGKRKIEVYKEKRQIHTIFIRETYSELETTGKIRAMLMVRESSKCDLMNSDHAPVNDNPFILQIGLI